MYRDLMLAGVSGNLPAGSSGLCVWLSHQVNGPTCPNQHLMILTIAFALPQPSYTFNTGL